MEFNIKYGEYDFNMDLKVVKTDMGVEFERSYVK